MRNAEQSTAWHQSYSRAINEALHPKWEGNARRLIVSEVSEHYQGILIGVGSCGNLFRSGRVSSFVALVGVSFALSQFAKAQQPAQTLKETASNPATAAESATKSVSKTSEGHDRYRIGPGDVLDVRIFNRPNLSREVVRVEGNGMIRMPLIDSEILAVCHTEGELALAIASRHKRFYRNPQVDVFINEYRSKQVAIIGAVND